MSGPDLGLDAGPGGISRLEEIRARYDELHTEGVLADVVCGDTAAAAPATAVLSGKVGLAPLADGWSYRFMSNGFTVTSPGWGYLDPVGEGAMVLSVTQGAPLAGGMTGLDSLYAFTTVQPAASVAVISDGFRPAPSTMPVLHEVPIQSDMSLALPAIERDLVGDVGSTAADGSVVGHVAFQCFDNSKAIPLADVTVTAVGHTATTDSTDGVAVLRDLPAPPFPCTRSYVAKLVSPSGASMNLPFLVTEGTVTMVHVLAAP